MHIDVFCSQGAEQVTHFCRLLPSPPEVAMSSGGESQPLNKPLSDSQRIRKVIRELLETERQYVKVRSNRASLCSDHVLAMTRGEP